MADFFAHKTADVQSQAIGAATRIWQFCVVLPNARIGADCNICSHVLIENDVIIGDRVTVKSGVQLWDGLRVESGVFIGPNATFSNDPFPRSKKHPAKFEQTHIGENASIGAGAVILPGIRIGQNAMVGAGAVVTRNVPAFAITVGNPARIIGYANETDDVDNKQKAAAPSQFSAGVTPLGIGTATLHGLRAATDMRGDLSAAEIPGDVPFDVKRYFLVYNVPSKETRGEHAHRLCHQFLVCVKGSCAVVVDDGKQRKEVKLDSPTKGLHLPPMTWGIQYKYSPDAVLLVLASHAYDPQDYIREYGLFLKEIGGHER